MSGRYVPPSNKAQVVAESIQTIIDNCSFKLVGDCLRSRPIRRLYIPVLGFIILFILITFSPRLGDPPSPPPVIRPRYITPFEYSKSRVINQLGNNASIHYLEQDLVDFSNRDISIIPKIIHQIYVNTMVPSQYVPLIKTWIKHHPDHEYWLWDDISARKLVRDHYRQFLPLWDAYCHPLFRSDALRYFILHHYGGIYIDMDYESFKNVRPLIDRHQCLVVQENDLEARVLYNEPFMVMNAWMASVPGHPFMNFTLNRLPHRASCNFHKVLESTGPLMLFQERKSYLELTDCKEQESCYVDVLPSKLMMPQWDASGNFEESCKKNPENLLKKIACKKILETKGLPTIDNSTYASHKFLHFGNIRRKHGLKKVDITKIIDNVIIPRKRGKI